MLNSIYSTLRWPAKEGNFLNPWYVILWRLLLLPLVLAFGVGFYFALTLSGYGSADYFKRDWLTFPTF